MMKEERVFVRRLYLLVIFAIMALPLEGSVSAKPNVILLIADDLGWKDTGYSGNPVVKTPALDEMAAKGIRFDYFYAAGHLCCPGRYAILTGRSPLRGRIALNTPISPDEILLPRILKSAGYASAYFGKWHLGSKNSSPVKMGFDEATWAQNQFDIDPKFLINDTGESIQQKGDGSVAIMQLALDYLKKRKDSTQPVFMTIGFAAPHTPNIGAPEYLDMFKKFPDTQAQFLAELAGMDAAIGMLRKELRQLGIAENTLIWFMSDNGAANGDLFKGLTTRTDPAGRGKGKIGTRTAGLLEWPARIQKPVVVTVPCGQVDVCPTILDIAGAHFPDKELIDGISLLPLMDGKMNARSKPLGFLKLDIDPLKNPVVDFSTQGEGVWIDGKYELDVEPRDRKGQQNVRLYEIFKDPSHKDNLAPGLSDVVKKMRADLEEWEHSVRQSYDATHLPPKN